MNGRGKFVKWIITISTSFTVLIGFSAHADFSVYLRVVNKSLELLEKQKKHPDDPWAAPIDWNDVYFLNELIKTKNTCKEIANKDEFEYQECITRITDLKRKAKKDFTKQHDFYK